MKRNILIYGLILGTVICINMIYMVNLCYTNPDFESNDVLGYAAMVVIFSLIFFGIRNYRNKQNNGVITFGRALKMGTLIALIGSTMYVGVWLIYYYNFVPDYLDVYIPHCLNDAAKNGATASELAEKTEDMKQLKEMYKSPFFVVLISYAEVFPVGFVVALISALLLKRRQRDTQGHEATAVK
jgi:hypothetical protein